MHLLLKRIRFINANTLSNIEIFSILYAKMFYLLHTLGLFTWNRILPITYTISFFLLHLSLILGLSDLVVYSLLCLSYLLDLHMYPVYSRTILHFSIDDTNALFSAR